MIYTIETICEKLNIRSRGITAAYDGFNSIKSMNTNTTYLCQSNHFDLILGIDNKQMKYPLTWSWRYIKVNQNEFGEPLDRCETKLPWLASMATLDHC